MVSPSRVKPPERQDPAYGPGLSCYVWSGYFRAFFAGFFAAFFGAGFFFIGVPQQTSSVASQPHSSQTTTASPHDEQTIVSPFFTLFIAVLLYYQTTTPGPAMLTETTPRRPTRA